MKNQLDKKIWEKRFKNPEQIKLFETKPGQCKPIPKEKRNVNKININEKNKISSLEYEIKQLKYQLDKVRREQTKIGRRVNETSNRQEETQRQILNTNK